MKVFDGVREIRLGSKLGAGADGSVFRCGVDDKVCIKIFDPRNRPELLRKLPKIKILVQRGSSLHRDAAVPIHLVSEHPSGPPIGFAMQLVVGKEVHNLYGVSSRKIHFPSADFRFLVQAAKNAAIAMNRIHANRIVVGDISGRNLMVRKDATVCWIDADSFLIGSPDFLETGRLITPEWTPPELQNNEHLQNPRQPSHDCFGLAVLIFHLLMLGRHPFQGRFTGYGEAPDLPSNIRQRFYAHAGFSAIPLQPPIGTPPIGHLGDQLCDLFKRAFLADLAQRRPIAAEWVEALNRLEGGLKHCSRFHGHFYSNAASACPWCQLLPAYGDLDVFPVAMNPNGFHADGNTGQLVAEINAFISRLGSPHDIANTIFRPVARQVAPTWSYQEPGWFASIFAAKSSEKRKLANIREAFESELEKHRSQISQSFQKQQTWLDALAGVSRKFTVLQREAAITLREATLIQTARKQLEIPILKRRREEHLAHFPIEADQIVGIGKKRVRELNGHGIVTAADVVEQRIISIPGFGYTLTAAILAWREGRERTFRVVAVGVPTSDIEKRACELLHRQKPDFINRRELLLREISRITGDARACANKAAAIQQQIDLRLANIAAVNAAIRRLS